MGRFRRRLKSRPWDHVEACMGLSIAGKKDEAEQAFLWLSDNQLEDGSWYSEYLNQFLKQKEETNFRLYRNRSYASLSYFQR